MMGLKWQDLVIICQFSPWTICTQIVVLVLPVKCSAVLTSNYPVVGCGFAWKKALKILEKSNVLCFGKAAKRSHCFLPERRPGIIGTGRDSSMFCLELPGLEISPGCLVRCRAVPAASGTSSTRPDASLKFHGLLLLLNPAGQLFSYVTFAPSLSSSTTSCLTLM